MSLVLPPEPPVDVSAGIGAGSIVDVPVDKAVLPPEEVVPGDDEELEDGEDEAVNNVATKEHCFHAFDALYCALTGSPPVAPQFVDDKYPLFVTWNTRSSRPGRLPRLRGCIGTFEPTPLHEGLAEYALISAFKDSRYNPIEERELPQLECAISLLTDFEDADSYLDWTVGKHGIRVHFSPPTAHLSSSTSSSSTPSPFSSSPSLLSTRFSSFYSSSSSYTPKQRTLSATYLPDVAPEQGWDKREAVDSAIRKAGWDGRITEELRRSVRLRRYQSSKCSVSWEEYVAWRRENGDGEV